METFNRWAFVYVGIYGYKFMDAGRAVMQLFHDRGFDAIINDDLVGTALTFAAFGVGCLCALLGLVYYYIDVSNQFQYAEYILPLTGLLDPSNELVGNWFSLGLLNVVATRGELGANAWRKQVPKFSNDFRLNQGVISGQGHKRREVQCVEGGGHFLNALEVSRPNPLQRVREVVLWDSLGETKAMDVVPSVDLGEHGSQRMRSLQEPPGFKYGKASKDMMWSESYRCQQGDATH
ncbi:hypothetical protein DYB26_013098 [Aphanomyces astaci]|uniref:Choline transporter-like protein n=1 Tax=Aphanomyces astaci TaxID=112090 RepID=A0A3R7BBY9_APHAT|nr:hypothetical protein DYB26_013098 [Aphanomyces astaci]